MAKYFILSHGLREWYMPDGEPLIVMCATRHELKSAIADEVSIASSDATQGGSKRAVACVATAAWREAHKANPTYLEFVVPLKKRHQSSYSYGVMVSVSTRREYLERNREES